MYTAGSKALNRVGEFKYLGLVIANNIHWDKHIAPISNGAMSKLNYLKRCLKSAYNNSKLVVYESPVLPILECANVIWDPFIFN